MENVFVMDFWVLCSAASLVISTLWSAASIIGRSR